MKLDVTFRNIEATDALRDRASAKFQKVARHLKEPIEGHLTLRVERHRHTAEIIVHSAGSETLKTHETTGDMYASVDGVMKKLRTHVRRRRDQAVDRQHGRQLAPQGDGFVTDLGVLPDDYLDEETEEVSLEEAAALAASS